MKRKEDLKKEIEELQLENEILQNDVDYWQEQYNELFEQLEQLELLEDNLIIKDVDNFIDKLELYNLYNDDLKNFIELYMRIYNK